MNHTTAPDRRTDLRTDPDIASWEETYAALAVATDAHEGGGA